MMIEAKRMARVTAIVSLLMVAILPTDARAEAERVDRGIWVQLNTVGLDIMGDLLEADVLRDITDQPVPDSESAIDGGARAYLYDMKVTVDYQSLDVGTHEDQLKVGLGIRDARLDIGRARVTKRVLGQVISLTCHGISLHFGEATGLTAQTTARPFVEDGNFRLESTGVDFALSDENYRVEGPDRCSGRLGVGVIWSALVRYLLDNARENIQQSVRDQIADETPAFAEALNFMFRAALPIELPAIPGMPQQEMVLASSPRRAEVADGALDIELTLDVEARLRDLREVFDVTGRYKMGASYRLFETDEALGLTDAAAGNIGVNLDILSAAFRSAFPNGTPSFELDPESIPNIDDILVIHRAASIWPDLNVIEPGADHLRLFASLPEAPRFELIRSADEELEGGNVRVVIPTLRLNFWVHHQGDWMPYFQIDVSLDGSLVLEEDRERSNLRLRMTEPATIGIEGQWADTYEPEIPIFEQDVAELLFESVFEYLYAQGPLGVWDLPELPVVGEHIRLSDPHVSPDGPFLAFRLRDAR